MKKITLESEEQQVFCQWLDLVGVTYFAVNNENIWSGILRSFIKNKSLVARIISAVEKKLKSLGKKKGVLDMVILLEGGKAVFIEMKRVKGGKVSEEQGKWLERLKVLGFNAHVCKGAGEAIATIEKYLPESKKKINVNQKKLF